MIYFLIILASVLLDLITKNIILRTIGIGGQSITVIENFFYITCHRNSGAAWGILQNGRYILIAVTTVLLAAMVFLIIQIKIKPVRILFSLIIGGAIGNYIDRILYGGVVDFLDFYILGYNFPTFNAADSLIVIGSILFLIYVFFFDKELFEKKTKKVLSEDEDLLKDDLDGDK